MILWSVWGEIREVLIRFDQAAFGWIDNIYDLFTNIASQEIISSTVIHQIVRNMYVLVGVFALFRIAVLLVNSIINPDALNKSGVGISKIFINTVIMLVLFVITPFLFELSRTFSNQVVNGNYIQKLFLSNTATNAELEPGQDMQRIVVGSVLSIDPDLNNCENSNIIGNSSCKEAKQCVDDINKAQEGGSGCWSNEKTDDGKVKGIRWNKIASYNGTRTKNSDNEAVYDIDYKPLVLTVIGWTITYILLSFTFDVAKRVVELAVLEIVSPLFIATIVDPRSMQNGPFKKWLKTLGNSYIGLFIRIAIISLIILLSKLLVTSTIDFGALGKPIILIAFLIFCKQLPKWVSDMIGIDGDGTGLGSLGIGKKIGSAALIGGLATKAGHGLVGNAVAGLGNARAALRDNRNKRKAAYGDGLSRGIGKKARAARNAWYDENGAKEQYAGMSKRAALRAARKQARQDNNLTAGKQAAKVIGGAMIGGVEGFKAGYSADSVKAAASAAKAKIGTVNGVSLGLDTTTGLKQVGKKISSGYDSFVGSIYGNPMQRHEANEALKKRKTREEIYNTAEVAKNGIDLDKLAGGFNDVKQLGTTDNMYDIVAANYAKAKGYNVSYAKDADGNYLKDSDGKRILEITDQNNNIVNSDTMFDAGSKILGSTGLTRLATYQNQIASNASSESDSNSQYMNNLATSIANMQSDIGNIHIPGLNSNGNIEINGASLCINGTNTPLKINKDSVRDLGIAFEEASRQMKIEQNNSEDSSKTQEERKIAKEKADQYQNLANTINQTIVMKTQLNGAVKELGELQSRQEDLQFILNSVGKVEVDTKTGKIDTNAGKTFASSSERETYLSKQAEKFENINNPGKDEK